MIKQMTMALALGLTAVTGADAKTYICEIEEQGNSGWIPELVVVAHDEGSGQVTVFDPVIKHYKDSPIPGELGIVNDRRTSYNWTIDGMTATGGGKRQFVSGFAYRLVIQKKNLKATITGKPSGYRNSYRGKGTCKIED